MGDRYLTNLADVIRAVGIDVLEVGGWQHIARGSGGYTSGLPNHVMVHHTASGPGSDGWSDVEYMTFAADAAPLANLYLSRSGTVWVCAGGATNTNGSGHDPCGTVADDSMNAAAIGIEAANNGVGERWPDVQLDVYEELVAALCSAYGIPVGRVHAHFEYAPGRKIDPAGPDRYATGGASWDMDRFRTALTAPIPPDPPDPPPDLEVTDMPFLIRDNVSGAVALVYGSGKLVNIDGNVLDAMVDRFGPFLDMDPGTYQAFVHLSD